MNITPQLLEINGFKKKEVRLLPTIHYDQYEKFIPNQANITLTIDAEPEERYTNTPNRQWHCHIDNELMEAIGNADVQTTQHLKLICQLFDIEYNLLLKD